MASSFDFLPQAETVQNLLNACIASLPHLPAPEKQVMIDSIREFEVFAAPTLWSAEDVDGDESLGLTADEKRQAIALFAEHYDCKDADWSAIEQYARDVLLDRKPTTGPYESEEAALVDAPQSFRFFSDPGHGWLEVPIALLEELGVTANITPHSYRKGSMAYLEEDCDLSTFVKAMKNANRSHKIVDVPGDSGHIRNFNFFGAN